MATQRIITTDDPKHPAQVYGFPYFLPAPLAEVLGPTIIDYLDQQLPILLPPYIDPAAEQAVLQYAVQLTGSTMTGPLYLSPLLPTAPGEAASKEYVDTQIATVDAGLLGYLPLSGGTLTGPLVLSGTPSAAGQAVNVAYVVNNFLQLAGGTLTGDLVAGGAISADGSLSSRGAGRIISEGSANNPSVACWDATQAAAAGILMTAGDILMFASMDGSGTYLSERARLDAAGNFETQGTVNGVPLRELADLVASLTARIAALEARMA